MSQRYAVLLDGSGRPASYQGKPMAVPYPYPTMTKTGHVSGNQQDVFHCPFCGSGDIVSRPDGSIECGFDNSAFTVTVSPMYTAFPMSVNGQPYPWPGRPDGMDPAMMGDPNAAAGGGDGFGGQLIPGGGGDGADDDDADGDDAPPWAKDDDGGADDSAADADDDTEAEVGGKKQPPFVKKKSVLVTGGVYGRYRFRTVTGALLPEQEFVRHLAIATAKDPNAMAASIRQERVRT